MIPVTANPKAPSSQADLSPAELAAIAIAIHTAQGLADDSALIPNQSGVDLPINRWVSVGRALNTRSWQRS